jgi:hypothetical protein
MAAAADACRRGRTLFIGGLLIATVAAIRRWPLAGFLGVWFFVTLAPTSSFVPIATEVGAERRMYLPLLAVVALAVVAVSAAWAVVVRTHQRRACEAALRESRGALALAARRSASTLG